MTWSLFLVPFISAFSCWLVIRLFVYYLFHPINPVQFAGLRIQGIFPSKQAAIAVELGKLAAREFFSAKIVEEKIADPSNLQRVMPVIEEHIDEFLRHKLKKEMPFVSVFIGEKTIGSLKKVFMNELEELFPRIVNNFVSQIVADLNIEKIIVEKINSISAMSVALAIHKNYSKQLRLAETAAALIGLLIGLLGMIVICYVK